MLVRMSFTITMAIFGAGLICCLMFGCNDRLAASPVETKTQRLSKGTQRRRNREIKDCNCRRYGTFSYGIVSLSQSYRERATAVSQE